MLIPLRKKAFLALVLTLCAPAIMGGARIGSDFSERILAAHNGERDRFGVPALHWDPGLAVSAKAWADHLGRTGQFRHSPDQAGEAPQGENLWAGSKGYYRFEDMVALWVAEKVDYKSGVFPNNSRSGNLENVGHYTQLIWRDTRAVGCAFSSGAEEEFLVCRYSKAGNVTGERPV